MSLQRKGRYCQALRSCLSLSVAHAAEYCPGIITATAVLIPFPIKELSFYLFCTQENTAANQAGTIFMSGQMFAPPGCHSRLTFLLGACWERQDCRSSCRRQECVPACRCWLHLLCSMLCGTGCLTGACSTGGQLAPEEETTIPFTLTG